MEIQEALEIQGEYKSSKFSGNLAGSAELANRDTGEIGIQYRPHHRFAPTQQHSMLPAS